MLLQRYKIIIEYLGTEFCGWQRQNNGISVQQKIEDAIFSMCAQRVHVTAAGRTDAGVHAIGQAAHFDLDVTKRWYEPNQILSAINHFVMPSKVAVLSCDIAPNDFHARFSALKRYYIYKIINRESKVVINQDLCWWIRQPLQIDRMREASDFLIGNHDFSAFRASVCQAKSPVKTIEYIEIKTSKEEIIVEICAQSFLHHMIRNILGSLVNVGLGKWKPGYIKTILDSRSRILCGPTAPAQGLYFLKVDY